ncbi:MAG: nucleotidyltransferase family protein, partial [Actinomycetia bacterium]|nr:nucleotidyltransferase family protein [Actinomycetes bacterium]
LDHGVQHLGLEGDADALTVLAMLTLESAADLHAAQTALDTLLNVADDLGIDVAIFKGMAIGSRWYDDPSLRPAYDIDIFVAPEQLDRMGELAAHFDPAPGTEQAISAMVKENRVFEHTVSIDGFDVDIHRDPMNLTLESRLLGDIWVTAEPIELPNGTVVRMLNLEWSLIQALLHLFRDNFADLLHIYDVALMLDADPDWGAVAAYVEREGWTDLIRFSLGYVCDVLGRTSPLPTVISPQSRMLITTVWPRRLRLQGHDSVARAYRRQSLTGILVRGRRLETVRPLALRVFPPRSVIDHRSTATSDPYIVALYRWRRAQHRQARAARAPDRRP